MRRGPSWWSVSRQTCGCRLGSEGNVETGGQSSDPELRHQNGLCTSWLPYRNMLVPVECCHDVLSRNIVRVRHRRLERPHRMPRDKVGRHPIALDLRATHDGRFLRLADPQTSSSAWPRAESGKDVRWSSLVSCIGFRGDRLGRRMPSVAMFVLEESR